MAAHGQLSLRPDFAPTFLPKDPLRFPVTDLPGYADSGRGEVLASWLDGERRIPAIRLGSVGPEPLFDWNALAQVVLHERWIRFRRPFYTHLPFHYHRVNGHLRFGWIARQYRRRFRATGIPAGFPAWPAEGSVDLLRHLAGRYGWGGTHALPGQPWPEARSHALVLTHDVDSGAAWPWVRMMADLERSMGVRSAWNIVPDLYPLDYDLLDRLVADGHEIGLHGHDHRGVLPWLPADRIARTLAQHWALRERYGIVGYRSPSLFRSDAMYQALSGEFLYDSSVPDTELFCTHSDQNGCASIFPFSRNGLIILPITMPQDAIWMFLGLEPDEALRIYRSKLEWIRSLGGMALVNTHPDPWFSGSRQGMCTYGRLIESLLAAPEDPWKALPADVARWWARTANPMSVGGPRP